MLKPLVPWYCCQLTNIKVSESRFLLGCEKTSIARLSTLAFEVYFLKLFQSNYEGISIVTSFSIGLEISHNPKNVKAPLRIINSSAN